MELLVSLKLICAIATDDQLPVQIHLNNLTFHQNLIELRRRLPLHATVWNATPMNIMNFPFVVDPLTDGAYLVGCPIVLKQKHVSIQLTSTGRNFMNLCQVRNLDVEHCWSSVGLCGEG